MLAAVSLLLCVAVIVDRWAQRSNCHWFGFLTWHTGATERVTRCLSVTLGRGVVIFTQYAFANESDRNPPPESHLEYGSMQGVNWKMDDTLLGRAGFGIDVYKAV